ncbi:glycosyltransferase family 2 protein [Ruegeria sp. HKCCA5426]|uniref:glycosyltransferase family 2 protein n=1 Tax=Ruegeria sp. HKCCA5426 TaxID=2682985 RepID=UPI0035304D6A
MLKEEAASGVKGSNPDHVASDDTVRIAIILPCYNEEAAIELTVSEFKEALPDADVYVFDNNSSDATIEVAQRAGATVRSETNQGKGNVVRRMFADVEADVYVMADGDATYDASNVTELIALLRNNNLDMVNGARKHSDDAAYRPGHKFGNRMLTSLVKLFFGRNLEDMLSGYRVFSRRFVKSFPSMSSGFEIETELTVHALQMRLPIDEVQVKYRARPENSVSKLSTYGDGLRILRMIGFLVKEEKPLLFFFSLAGLIFIPSGLVFLSVLLEFLETSQVARFPSLFAALTGFLMSIVCIACALILDTVSRGRREARRLSYLQYEAPKP